MAENERSSAEDLSSGVKTGINAAKSVKRMAAVAGNLATGNVVGAAANSKMMRSLALFLVVTILFVLFVAIFYFPMAIYEVVSSAIEEWKIDYYSGTNGRFVSFFKASINFIPNIIANIKNRTSYDSTDEASESDTAITTSQGDLNIVYARKIKAAKEKITARQKQIIDKIKSDGASGQIYSIMAGRFASEFGASGVEYDVQYIEGTQQIASSKVNVYDGSPIMATNRSIKDMEALQLLCLHTIQKGGDLANVKLSAFMRWLGYNGADNRKLSFCLGDNPDIIYNMKSWTGGFIPQYLEDEAAEYGRREAREEFLKEVEKAKENGTTVKWSTKSDEDSAAQTMTEKYEAKYGASIADILIQVDCPNLYSIPASVTEELKEDAGTATMMVTDYSKPIYGPSPGDMYPAYLRDRRPTDYYSTWYRQGYRYIERVYCEGRFGNYLYHRGGWYVTYVNGMPSLVRTSANPKMRGPIIGYEETEQEYHYDITYYHVKYTVPVTVRCRDIDGLLDIAGLWKGPLPWDASYGLDEEAADHTDEAEEARAAS